MIGWHHQLNGHESEQTPGDGEAWCAAVHGVAKSQTRLRDWTTKYIHKVEQWSSSFKSRTSPIIPEGNPIYIVIFKIYIWSSSTVSGSQLPEPLNFWRRVIKMSFGYVNEVTLRSTQGSGLMPEGPSWNFQCHPLPAPSYLQRWGEGLGVQSTTSGQWFSQSRQCEEASTKTQKNSFQALFWELSHQGTKTLSYVTVPCPKFHKDTSSFVQELCSSSSGTSSLISFLIIKEESSE